MHHFRIGLHFLCTIISLAAVAQATAIHQGLHPHRLEDVDGGLKAAGEQSVKRQTPLHLVRGVEGAGVKPRLELRELARNADMLNLLLQGWERFMAMDQSDTLSYYQIAGIHGTPYTSWQGLDPGAGVRLGYCPHYSNLFMSWHRPYLALFEQVLYFNIQDIVAMYPDGSEKTRLSILARDIRLPYWDWARNPISGMGGVIPDILANTHVDVRRPDGTVETITNPLYSYKFHPHDPIALYDRLSGGVENFAVTKRRPTARGLENPNATDNMAEAHSLFNRDQQPYKERIYNIFWKSDNYTVVSNAGWWAADGANANQDNFELVHGMPHISMGGSGHMLYTPQSSYDPAFWLHHAMVDRLIAIWQTLHPDSYVESAIQRFSTFAFRVGSIQDVNSPLYPFPRTQDQMWTSAEVRKPQIFGYSYSELDLSDTGALTAAINELYGPSSITVLKKKRRNGEDRTIDLSANFIEYTALVVMDRLAITGSFVVFLFIGEPTGPASTWDNAINLVGNLPVFSMHSELADDIGAEPEWISGPVPLTSEVRKRWLNNEFDDMREKTVVPWLKKGLRWRVRKQMDMTEVAVDQISSLNVTISTSEIRPPQQDTAFPIQISTLKEHVVDDGEPKQQQRQAKYDSAGRPMIPEI